MKMNWWSWIFSQQAGVHCSVPLEWIPPSGSPLQQNTQSRAKEWPPLCSSGSGCQGRLTGQVLTAVSLAEPDQQRQGQHKGLDFLISHKHVSLPATNVFVNIYPQMASEHPHSIWCLYFRLVCLEQWKSIKQRQFHLQEFEAMVFAQ